MGLISLTAGGTIDANDVVYVDSSGLAHKASAVNLESAIMAGVALDSGGAGALIRVNPDGYYGNFTGLVPGEVQYLSLTSGELTTYANWVTDLTSSSLEGAYLARVGTAATTSGLDVEISLSVFVSASGL